MEVRVLGQVDSETRSRLERAATGVAELRRIPVPTIEVKRWKEFSYWAAERDPRDVQKINITRGALAKLNQEETTAAIEHAMAYKETGRNPFTGLGIGLGVIAGSFGVMMIVTGLAAAAAAGTAIILYGLSVVVMAGGLYSLDAWGKRKIHYRSDAKAAMVLGKTAGLEGVIAKSPRTVAEMSGPFQRALIPFALKPTRAARIQALQRQRGMEARELG